MKPNSNTQEQIYPDRILDLFCWKFSFNPDCTELRLPVIRDNNVVIFCSSGRMLTEEETLEKRAQIIERTINDIRLIIEDSDESKIVSDQFSVRFNPDDVTEEATEKLELLKYLKLISSKESEEIFSKAADNLINLCRDIQKNIYDIRDQMGYSEVENTYVGGIRSLTQTGLGWTIDEKYQPLSCEFANSRGYELVRTEYAEYYKIPLLEDSDSLSPVLCMYLDPTDGEISMGMGCGGGTQPDSLMEYILGKTTLEIKNTKKLKSIFFEEDGSEKLETFGLLYLHQPSITAIDAAFRSQQKDASLEEGEGELREKEGQKSVFSRMIEQADKVSDMSNAEAINPSPEYVAVKNSRSLLERTKNFFTRGHI